MTRLPKLLFCLIISLFLLISCFKPKFNEDNFIGKWVYKYQDENNNYYDEKSYTFDSSNILHFTWNFNHSKYFEKPDFYESFYKWIIKNNRLYLQEVKYIPENNTYLEKFENNVLTITYKFKDNYLIFNGTYFKRQ